MGSACVPPLQEPQAANREAAARERTHTHRPFYGRLCAAARPTLLLRSQPLSRYGAHRDWRVHPLHVGLLDEDLSSLCAERFDLRLLDVLAAAQLLDLAVQIGRARHSCAAAGLRCKSLS